MVRDSVLGGLLVFKQEKDGTVEIVCQRSGAFLLLRARRFRMLPLHYEKANSGGVEPPTPG